MPKHLSQKSKPLLDGSLLFFPSLYHLFFPHCIVESLADQSDRLAFSYQSDDCTLGRELCRAEQCPDESIDEFVFGVCAGVIIRNLLPLSKEAFIYIIC